ncbi:MAG TPA: MCE family protein [Acidimicrobiales bacterium]|nr:MCE family protein [Acidimicrobiales bacterium]
MTRRLALLVLIALTATAFPACGRHAFEVRATFDDVGDLQPRHSVQVADVRVGHIVSIHLTNDFRAEVTMSIDAGRKIPKNSEAVLRTTSLLGEKFVELRALGDPAAAPYLHDGDVVARTEQAPELEFVAEAAVNVLGGVVGSDVATLINTGAEAFGGRGDDLRRIIDDLSQLSATLAGRSAEIQTIIDHFDTTTRTLSASAGDLSTLFANLAQTTKVLADNRQLTIDALAELSRLARVQNDVLDRYRGDIDRQIKQVDAILTVAAGQTGEIATLLDWLQKFIIGLPQAIPGDFAQVYGWFVTSDADTRPKGPAGNNAP